MKGGPPGSLQTVTATGSARISTPREPIPRSHRFGGRSEQAGILRTNRGFRAPADVVAPSLVKYEGLLPLFKGPSQVADALELPDELEAVPAKVLRDALGAEIFPPAISDSTLVDFILTADRIAYPNAHPPSIPARVRKAVEARPPGSVYLATTDEQQEYLSQRHRPYLARERGAGRRAGRGRRVSPLRGELRLLGPHGGTAGERADHRRLPRPAGHTRGRQGRTRHGGTSIARWRSG